MTVSARVRIPSTVWKWLLAIVMSAVVTLMLLILAGVFHRKVQSENANANTTIASELPTLRTHAVERIVLPRYKTATGTVKQIHESAVASKLLARVVEMNIVAGQTVIQDQILVKLDDAELQARLKQAEAGLVNAQVQRDKAELDFDREKQLRAKNANSQAAFDAANAAAQGSEAALT